jgi:F0F1-type ATP synthase assembly protein I
MRNMNQTMTTFMATSTQATQDHENRIRKLEDAHIALKTEADATKTANAKTQRNIIAAVGVVSTIIGAAGGVLGAFLGIKK